MLLSNSGGDSHMLISNSGGGQEEGGVGGSRTSVVFVQATRPVERDEEFFANYGTGFRFPHGCECHLCGRHVATSCCQLSVRPKRVLCEVFIMMYEFFDFGVNKFISSVNLSNHGMK
jgi:hypothetical protein